MGKFKATEAVDRLEFDFEDVGNGAKGFIPEPSTALVNGFMKNMKDLVREASNISRRAKGLQELDEDALEGEDLEKHMAAIDEFTAEADKFQDQSVEYLAVLCGAEWDEATESYKGGSPSLEDLQSLPYRHLQAFSAWLMGEIRPKKDQPAGKR